VVVEVVNVGVRVGVGEGKDVGVSVGVGEIVEVNEGGAEGVDVGESEIVFCCGRVKVVESPTMVGGSAADT
jgi:hypothetical protein